MLLHLRSFWCGEVRKSGCGSEVERAGEGTNGFDGGGCTMGAPRSDAAMTRGSARCSQDSTAMSFIEFLEGETDPLLHDEARHGCVLRFRAASVVESPKRLPLR